MTEWIQATLAQSEWAYATLPAAVLLGLLAISTSCCTPVVFLTITGYCSSGEKRDHKASMIAAICFLIGTVAALSVVGLLVSAVDEVTGQYSQGIAGMVMVFFGLMALGITPVRIPKFKMQEDTRSRVGWRAAAFGFVVGGSSVTCTLLGNPLIGIPLGVALLEGKIAFGAGILTAFAIGYSLPLALVLLGTDRLLDLIRGSGAHLTKVIRTTAGVLMLTGGFYLLLTL